MHSYLYIRRLSIPLTNIACLMLSAYQANLAAFMVGKLAPGALIDKFTDIGQLPGGKVCLLEAISRCVLHSVTVCCSALQCVVLCGSALQCVAQY